MEISPAAAVGSGQRLKAGVIGPWGLAALALSATILYVKGGQLGTIGLGPFDPSHATQGVTGFWQAVILGLLAFSGFDVVATAAEEAQAPRENVPRVLIIAIIAIALFWVTNAWALTLSTPAAQIDAYNAAGLTAISPVARAYWGWGNLIVIATAFTGIDASRGRRFWLSLLSASSWDSRASRCLRSKCSRRPLFACPGAVSFRAPLQSAWAPEAESSGLTLRPSSDGRVSFFLAAR